MPGNWSEGITDVHPQFRWYPVALCSRPYCKPDIAMLERTYTSAYSHYIITGKEVFHVQQHTADLIRSKASKASKIKTEAH